MKKALAAICLSCLLLTDAMASDNNAVIAFARKNAEKFKNELTEVKGVVYGSTVTLQGVLDRITVTISLQPKYDPETEEMVIGSPYATLNALMFLESCKPKGSFLGQNAFGAKVVVHRETCERFFAQDGDGMAVPIAGVRIKMSPSQFRAINKAGVIAELDFTVGHPKKDVTVDYREHIENATLDEPIQWYLKDWTVYGRIEEVRWALPREKSAKGTSAILWRSPQRTPPEIEAEPSKDEETQYSRIDDNGNNGLHLAIWQGLTKKALRIIESRKVDLNQRNKFGATALHLAVAKDNAQVVQALIDAGASTLIRDNEGNTPLMNAQGIGNRIIIEILQRADNK